MVWPLAQIEGSSSTGNYFLSHRPSLSIGPGLPTSLLAHPAINPTSLCPFASRHPHSSFLFLWLFPSFSAPCDLGVISRELNGEAGGCISVQSFNSSSTMQTVLACYLNTQRNGWLKTGRLGASWGNRAGMLTTGSHKTKTWHVSLIAQRTSTGNKQTDSAHDNFTCFRTGMIWP